METWQLVVLAGVVIGIVQVCVERYRLDCHRRLMVLEHRLESDRITYQQELFMSSQEPEGGENWK